eukprot:NODE_42_length_34079_cov_0.552619.p3 type:complete len:358 gc:universal NODE_42_length_34079_cov_0.552619:10071-8998(-)
MFKKTIALIPGDGIGVTVIEAARQVLLHVGRKHKQEFDFLTLDAGFDYFQKTGSALPQTTISTLRDLRKLDKGKVLALFGAVSSPSHRVDGYKSPIVQLRRLFDCYANVRPVKGTFNGSNFDFVVMRENTECLYVQKEELNKDFAVASRIISRKASERIARMSFQIAKQRAHVKQQKVSIIHKANVLPATDGMFRESCIKIADEFKAVKVGSQNWRNASLVYNEVLVDAALYHLIRDPSQFDILCCPNMYGDLLSDAGAGMVGSLGLIPSVNFSDYLILGEPVHGSAPDIDPKLANPIAAVLSAALMCRFAGFMDTARAIEAGVSKCISLKEITPDCNGKLNCVETTEKIISRSLEL